MDCRKCEQLLSSYIDGELDGEAILDLEDHIKTCSACNALLDKFREMTQVIKSARMPHMRPGLIVDTIALVKNKGGRQSGHSESLRVWGRVPVFGVILLIALSLGGMAGKSVSEVLLGNTESRVDLLVIEDPGIADVFVELDSTGN
jgi:anti-sigma factor RsiW